MTELVDIQPAEPIINKHGKSRFLIVTLGGITAFASLSIDMYLPAFPRIADDLNTSMGSVQLTLSLFLAGFALGQLSWGTLSDHWGRRAPMLCGCVVFVGAALACAVSRSVACLICARFLMGFGGSAGVVVARAVVRDMFEEKESARFYSFIMIISGIAPIIAPSLGTLLLTWWTWRAIFWVVAIFAVLCILGVILIVPETLPKQSRARGHLGIIVATYWRLLFNRSFIGYVLVLGFISAALFVYIASVPSLLMELHGLSPRGFSFCFMANAGGIYIAGQSNRWLLNKLDPRQILFRGLTLNMATCLMLAITGITGIGGFPVFFGCLFVFTTSLGWIYPNGVAVAMKPVPEQAGSASALIGTLQFAFGAVAGSLVGVMHTGTATPAVSLIAITSFCAWLILVLQGPRKLPLSLTTQD